MRRHALLIAALAFGIAACAGSAPSPSAITTPATIVPSSPPAESAAPAGTDLTTVPTACINVGLDDCRRVVAEVGELVPTGTAPIYVQVGPFGCVEGGGCPRSLLARPQGDVTIEAVGGAISYHVTTDGAHGRLTIERQDAFLMALDPQSQPPVTPGVRRFTLGHCGLWSGIDVGGSWWDPIGTIDGDHPAAINSADGTLTILDRDRATFTADSGFTVQLVRREGQKGLPGCM